MAYFTILHILTLIILFVIFILLVVLTFREKRPKIFWSMIFANTLVIVALMVSSMFVLDTYTKKARVENLTQNRVLLTESIVFSGQIRNIGAFTIGKCIYEIKLVNNPISAGIVTGRQLFSPTSGLKYGGEVESSTVAQKFVIATNLKSGELRNFSVSMAYPPEFERTSVFQTLSCR